MIAIVDDDASVRKALSRLFRSEGLRVSTYESAEAFFDSNAVTEADCLILDVHLPGESGLELQTRLTASGMVRPIVFITAFDDAIARESALKSGAVEFLQKPLDSERLLEVVQGALKPA